MALLYVGRVLFGERSLMVLMDLQEQKANLQSEIASYKQMNSALQKEYFELLEMQTAPKKVKGVSVLNKTTSLLNKTVDAKVEAKSGVVGTATGGVAGVAGVAGAIEAKKSAVETKVKVKTDTKTEAKKSVVATKTEAKKSVANAKKNAIDAKKNATETKKSVTTPKKNTAEQKKTTEQRKNISEPKIKGEK